MNSNYTSFVLSLGATGLPMAARLTPRELVTSTGLLSTAVSSGPGSALTVVPSVLAGSVRT